MHANDFKKEGKTVKKGNEIDGQTSIFMHIPTRCAGVKCSPKTRHADRLETIFCILFHAWNYKFDISNYESYKNSFINDSYIRCLCHRFFLSKWESEHWLLRG